MTTLTNTVRLKSREYMPKKLMLLTVLLFAGLPVAKAEGGMMKGMMNGMGGGRRKRPMRPMRPMQPKGADMVQFLVEELGMAPHPEGGFFVETFRDATEVEWVDNFNQDGVTVSRDASTAIYYLLDRGSFSSLHQIADYEVWHYYAGECGLYVHVLGGGSPDNGEYERISLGNDFVAGQRPQAVVPAGAWFGAELQDEDCAYALVGNTVAPGFEFQYWRPGSATFLSEIFPNHTDLIQRLTLAD